MLALGAWCWLLVPMEAKAQSNPPFQNPSLDTNCYFPQIGDLSEMDTICGSVGGQELGSPVILNMGTKPNGGYGNMLIGDLIPPPVIGDNVYTLSQVETGPTFNLHKMTEYLQKINPDNSGYHNGLADGFVLGHFRDRAHLDILSGWKIYLSDDLGNYDSTDFVVLMSSLHGDLDSSQYAFYPNILPAYATHLTNDTIDDIVLSLYTESLNTSKDTCYLLLFRGRQSFARGDTVYEDTSCVLYSNTINYPFRQVLQGDFRGTGREDIIIMGDSGGTGWPGSRMGDIFFYANDPPFTLEKLVHAINYDTIMARWQNPKLLSQAVVSYPVYAMPVLPKSPNDKSVDFIPMFSDTANNAGIYIFQGGTNFGSRRITLDSAAYVIHQPSIFQGAFWGGFADAGDMTGTGNHVLYTTAGTGDNDWDAFFVTGQALDDKIDIYNSHLYGERAGDTLTANSDSLEDYLFRLASPDGSTKGSLWLYYGSKQIPVHLNPQFADVKSIPQQNGAGIIFSPNPITQSWSVATILWPEAENAEYEVYNILGSVVENGKIRMLGGAEQQRIYFPNLPNGTYIFEIRGESHEARSKLTIMR